MSGTNNPVSGLLGKVGDRAGEVAAVRDGMTWVKDALSRPQDGSHKGFEFVSTADQAEKRTRTDEDIRRDSGAIAVAATGAGWMGSGNAAAGAGLGALAHQVAEDYFQGKETPVNHYLTEDDLDRIRGDAPSLP